MRLIINDTSILIDLRKAELLNAALLLPYRFQVALPLVRLELVDFTAADIADLEARGLEIVDLPPTQVQAAIGLRNHHPRMSINDCFSVVMAMFEPGAILLTGDQAQRRNVEALGIHVHGVLWVSDHLLATQLATYDALLAGLERLESDPIVFLPIQDLAARIERLRALLRDNPVRDRSE